MILPTMAAAMESWCPWGLVMDRRLIRIRFVYLFVLETKKGNELIGPVDSTSVFRTTSVQLGTPTFAAPTQELVTRLANISV
jgi:hypothetical protein